MNKKFILELNEFNFDTLSDKYYPNLNKLINQKFNFIYTLPDEDKEYEGLDPWVQWPTIHNMVKTKTHKQTRHGLFGSKQQSIFSKLYKKKIKTDAWGIMNPPYDITKCEIYSSDPWSDIICNNPNYNKFAKNLKYIAENYHDLYSLSFIKNLFFLLINVIKIIGVIRFFNILRVIIFFTLRSLSFNSSHCFIFIDLLSWEIYKRFKSKSNVVFVFFNSLAHFQHNFNINDVRTTKFMDLSSSYLLRDVFNYSKINEYETFILTALSQKMGNGQIVYNFKDVNNFLNEFFEFFQIKYKGMTNEVVFKIHNNELNTIKRLNKLKFQNVKLFNIELLKDDENYSEFFLQFIYEGEKFYSFFVDNKKIIFDDFFYIYRIRKGVHDRKGFFLFNKINNPFSKLSLTKPIPNEKILNLIFFNK